MLLDAVFSPPFWIAIGVVTCAISACASSTRNVRKRRIQWLIVLAFALATSLFWANPSQMLHYSGPFSGEVVDAEDGKPVPIALLTYQWGGMLGNQSTHSAWTLTAPDGSYHLAWQGLGNWRLGAWPGPDSFYVLAPGYAASRFFLDGAPRDPYSNFDAKALSASLVDGRVSLQRLQGSRKFNMATDRVLFGMHSRNELHGVALKFYDATYPRLCNGTSEWEPTDLAFSQLYQLATIIDPDRYIRSPTPDIDAGFAAERLGRLVVENQTPMPLDAATVRRLCAGLRLPEGSVQ